MTSKRGGNKKVRSAGAAPAKAAPARSPTVEMVKQLARILDTHGLSELIVESPEGEFTLRRGGGGLTMPATLPAQLAPAPAPMPATAAAPAPAPAADKPADDGLHTVTSPFVGTFYRAPNPDSAPYASVGDRVDKGAVLCIVEAMKLMNEIEADVAGEIAAILVENGDPVEYGQALFKIARA